ncbi:Uncharacterised protein [Vibrio cholerae]|uniref:Uncharacterized protein n=1 Tax=Vibrio cholerae TaxID=666 RepID=A0A655Y4Y8_VIBCL|nr:Uncharacterised protein [Vibrio cholerae]
MARGENVNGANPGTQERHFWLPEYTASSCHSSTSRGTPPSEVTASTIVNKPCCFARAPNACVSLKAPVDVSACTKDSIFASGCSSIAACTFSTLIGQPHSSSTTTTSAPQRTALSRIRSPNTPLRQTITLSPGSTRLTKQASIPALPGAETAIVNSFSVWKAYFNSCFSSSIIPINSGSR